MKTMKKLQTIVALFWAVLCVVPPASAGDEITVKNAAEFVSALGSDRTIILDGGASGREYDVTAARDNAKPAGGVYWRQVGDGWELIIDGAENLTIRGDAKGMGAILAASPRCAGVLTFDNCRNIRLEGFTAGHTEGGSQAGVQPEGAVFAFDNCDGATVERCDIILGSVGLGFLDTKNALVSDSSISRCVYSNVVIRDSRDIVFDRVSFMSVNYNSSDIEGEVTGNIVIYGSRNILFDDCSFFGQSGVGFALEDSANVKVNGAKFRDCFYEDLTTGEIELNDPQWEETKPGP
jgi:hypothetical protein